jgi:hypothetical protein
MTKLPELRGRALDGQAMNLPADLPPMAVVLIVGLSHEARMDVGHWKRALDAAGVPWISLAVSPEEMPAEAMKPIAEAMRARLAESLWSHSVQIHSGGPKLLEAFGWEADPMAKVLLVESDGTVLFSHAGPFSEAAEEALQEQL